MLKCSKTASFGGKHKGNLKIELIKINKRQKITVPVKLIC
jgi:hypothetical protein